VPPSFVGHQAAAPGVDRRLRAVGQLELAKNAADVLLDGQLADPEPFGDDAVAAAGGHQTQHLQLALAQAVGLCLAVEFGRDRGAQNRPAADCQADRGR
jgi:hypothetical protein